jgi:hypothetical protein
VTASHVLFDELKQALRSAANDCDMIARFPQSGRAFDRMRRSLKTVETRCNDIGRLREDARWFPIGMMMEECHQRARTWLHAPSVASKKLFPGLAANLRQLLAKVEGLETKATHRYGMILPKPQAAPLRQGRPVQVITPGGIIIPAGVTVDA